MEYIMGLEILAAALTIGSIYQGLETAEDEATAQVREGELKSKELGKSIAARAARQKTSFLSSGFALEGTPSAVIGSTFRTGKEDVNQLISNYESRANLTMSRARSGALKSLAGMTALSSVYSSDLFGDVLTKAADFGQQSGFISGSTAFDLLESYDESIGLGQ